MVDISFMILLPQALYWTIVQNLAHFQLQNQHAPQCSCGESKTPHIFHVMGRVATNDLGIRTLHDVPHGVKARDL